MSRNNIKTTVVNPPWLLDALANDGVGIGIAGRNRVGSVAEAYARVPLLFRGTRIRCNSLLNVPCHVYKLNEDGTRSEATWPFPVDRDWLMWRIQASLILAGGSPLAKLRNATRRQMNGPTQDLQWLNPFTINIQWDSSRGQRNFVQNSLAVVGGSTHTWTDDDICFVRGFAPLDDIGFGIAPAIVALQSSRVAYSIPQMAANFFENGAMPITTISVADGTDDDEKLRIQGFFQRAMRGLANAFRVLAVTGDVKIQTTQSKMKDLEMTNLKDEARKDIARALEMPVTLLDSDETFATATSHMRSYYTDTVGPDARAVDSALNRDVLNPMGMEVEHVLEEMSIFQEDEKERAGAFKTYVDSGMPPMVASALLGLKIPTEVQDLWRHMFDLSLMQHLTEAAGKNLITRDMWHVLQRMPKIDNQPVFVGATIRVAPDPNTPNLISGPQVQDSSEEIAPTPLPEPEPLEESPTTTATAGTPEEEQLRDTAREQKSLEVKRFVKLARRNPGRARGFNFEYLEDEEKFLLFADMKIVPAYGSDGHRAALKVADKRKAPYEDQVAGIVRDLVEKQKKLVLGNLPAYMAKSYNVKIGPPPPPTVWYDGWGDALREMLIAMLPAVGDQVFKDLNLSGSFDVSDPQVAQFIEDAAQRFATEVPDTTWEELQADLAEGIAAGEGNEALAERVTRVMGDRIASDALTIARTETAPAYGFASQTAWEQSGQVESKSWLSIDDNRTRPDHEEAHGQTVPLDEPFNIGGEDLMYPGDPDGSAENIINCRCTAMANLRELGEGEE